MTDDEKQAERERERERLQRMLDASDRMGNEGGYAERVKMIRAKLAELDGD